MGSKGSRCTRATRATSLEDGAAPGGPLPAYGVVARSGPAASERAVSAAPAPAAPAPAHPTAVDPAPGGIPAVGDLAVDGTGRLQFAWPDGSPG